MKKKILISLFFISLVSTAFAQNRSIKFKHEGTFDETLAQAAKSNKLIFFDASTSWCVPCKKMEAEVFTVDSIADFFNTNFINVHYDMEKGEGIELKKRFASDITAYPTLLFINGKGEIVHKIVGGASAAQLLDLSRPALNPQQSLQGLAKKFESGDHSVATFSAYLKVLDFASDHEKAKQAATTYFDALPETELQQRDVWALMTKYLFNIDSRSFKYVLNHQAELAKVHGEASVDDYILANLSREIGALSMAYYTGKPADEAKEAWLIKTLGSIQTDLAGQLQIKARLIAGRNKGDWDGINTTMTKMISEDAPFKSTALKVSLMLNFTRKFTRIAPPGHLPDALNWTDMLLKDDVTPPYAIDLLEFKKQVLSAMGKNDRLAEVDKELAAQKNRLAELQAKGSTFPKAVKGFI